MWKRNVGILLMFAPLVVGVGSLIFFMIALASSLESQSLEGLGAASMVMGISALVSLVALPWGAVLASCNSVSFSISGALHKGWEIFKGRAGLWIGVTLIMFAYSIVTSIGDMFMLDQAGEPKNSPLYYSVQLVQVVISLLLSFGVRRISILAARGTAYHFGDMFSGYANFVRWVLGSLLVSLIIILGTIALIIPGIYFAFKYMYVPYLLVEKKMGIMEALREGGAMTKGAKMDLFAFGLVSFALTLAGALVLGLGLLVVTPVLAIAGAVVYTMLQQRASQKM